MSGSNRAIYVNQSGQWVQATKPPYVFNGSQWVLPTAGYAYSGSGWQQFWPPTGTISLGGSGATSATSTWTVPSGVTSVNLTLVGGGGGGGTGSPIGVRPGGGGGGGGAGSVVQTYSTPVTPGQVLQITIGAGGAGAAASSGYSGLNGGTTSVTIGSTVIAALGGGGGGGTIAPPGSSLRNSPPGTGGSGGGGGACGDTGIQAGARAGSSPNANAGGQGWTDAHTTDCGGGGGGAGGPGGSAYQGANGYGGLGMLVTVYQSDGTTLTETVAGGGAGAYRGSVITPQTGGSGGGGSYNGGDATSFGSGGGGNAAGVGGAGFNGLVWISWPGTSS